MEWSTAARYTLRVFGLLSRPHAELRANLGKAEEMCRKVKMAVTNVERNRIKYPHIDDRELDSRKSFVAGLESVSRHGESYTPTCAIATLTMQRNPIRTHNNTIPLVSSPLSPQAVAAMKDAFGGRETAVKMDGDARRELHSRQSAEVNNEAQRQNTYNMANRDFLNDQAQQQSTIRRNQDVSLDKMSDSLDRLGQMAKAIDSELQEQDKIIDDVDKNIDEVQGRMDAAIKSVEKLLKTKSKCQMATIAVLVIIVVIGE